MTDLLTGVRSHPLRDRADDFYATPIEAVRSLLTIERQHLPSCIWEPACGDGAIVTPLRAAGYHVFATDLVDRDCPGSTAAVDFLMERHAPESVRAIVTNPPYKLARPFVERALDMAPYVAMLLRLTFLEGVERRTWLQNSSLARVHVSSRRLPMMHRHDWEGPKASSATAYAWFVWQQGHVGSPEIRWFDWQETAQ